MKGITIEQLNQLKKAGYNEKEIIDAVAEVDEEDDMRTLGLVGQDYDMSPPKSYNSQQSSFQYSPSDNLVKWQLELNDILERAEHILREDIIEFNENGEMHWAPNPEPEKRIFNNYGVQEILRVLSMYINRNTILSDYEPKEINYKVYDFGVELNNLIFMKYENFGLITLERRKNYPMLVREIVDIVHSSYKRALYGAEKESLRTARNISQQENIMPPNVNINTGEMRKERGLLNPLRYIGGKYK